MAMVPMTPHGVSRSVNPRWGFKVGLGREPKILKGRTLSVLLPQGGAFGHERLVHGIVRAPVAATAAAGGRGTPAWGAGDGGAHSATNKAHPSIEAAQTGPTQTGSVIGPYRRYIVDTSPIPARLCIPLKEHERTHS